jgi:hypothetical protein
MRRLNNKYSYQLFKLTPSKEQFIKKFEQLFSSVVLSLALLNLSEQ